MGEAARRKKSRPNALCICGSGRSAISCCWTNAGWYKSPVSMSLREMSPKSTVKKCYMMELGSCDGPISSEHLVSRAVIEWLADNQDIVVSGLPWLAPGETRQISSKSFTANCLCKAHNSALSPLDKAAVAFFMDFYSFFQSTSAVTYIVSGPDLERWFLKTLKAMAVSKNLSDGGAVLSGHFANSIDVISMLDDPMGWPDGAGLYLEVHVGGNINSRKNFDMAPVFKTSGELVGLKASLMGVDCFLLLEPLGKPTNINFKGALYRPDQIHVRHRDGKARFIFSWPDGVSKNRLIPAVTTLL